MNTSASKANQREEFLTPQQLAKALNVPLSWVYQKSREKGEDTIPRHKMGRYVRFKFSEVEEYLDRRYQS